MYLPLLYFVHEDRLWFAIYEQIPFMLHDLTLFRSDYVGMKYISTIPYWSRWFGTLSVIFVPSSFIHCAWGPFVVCHLRTNPFHATWLNPIQIPDYVDHNTAVDIWKELFYNPISLWLANKAQSFVEFIWMVK